MSDSDDDILNKTDALLGRYRKAPRIGEDPDADVPLLTEVVGTGSIIEITATKVQTALTNSDFLPEPDAMDGLSHLEHLIVAKLSEAIAMVVDESLTRAADKVRQDLKGVIERAVSDAVKEARAPEDDR